MDKLPAECKYCDHYEPICDHEGKPTGAGCCWGKQIERKRENETCMEWRRVGDNN